MVIPITAAPSGMENSTGTGTCPADDRATRTRNSCRLKVSRTDGLTDHVMIPTRHHGVTMG